MTLEPGDRVCWKSIDDDGLPSIRYGFIRSISADNGRVVLMLDDEIKSDTVAPANEVELVTITAVELRLQGVDLLNDPSLRGGLASLWSAEAEAAGLEIEVLPFDEETVEDIGTGWLIAEVHGANGRYMLHAFSDGNPNTICVRADIPAD